MLRRTDDVCGEHGLRSERLVGARRKERVLLEYIVSDEMWLL
jgi:hypothetical protein